MMRAVGSASPMMRLVAATAAFASVYFLVAVLTLSVIEDSGFAVLWPASGVYLGVMLVAPHRMWSALACGAFIGSLAAYLHAGSSFEVSIAFAIPSSAEGLLGAVLVERIAGRRFTLRGLHDVFALVLGGAVIANALVGLSAGAVAAHTFGVSFGESWLRWWSADALGVIAVAPIITAPLRPRRLRLAAIGGLGVALLVTRLADAELYTVQAFLAVLLLSWLALTVALTERRRTLADRERTTERLDETGRRVAQLTAELAARTAELHDAGRRRERLTEEIRDSQAASGRTEKELVDARNALARAVAERDRVQRGLDDSALAVGRLQAEQARTGEQLADEMSARQRVEQELERLGTRFENLRGELEQGRAQFAAQRRALEEELDGARTEHARTSERLAAERSARQRVERSLEEATRRLASAEAERRLLAERAADRSSRYDDRGTCLDASPAFCRLLGYEPGELVGRPGAELLHVEDRPRLARARATRSDTTFEARLRRKAGDFVWVEVSLHPVCEGPARRLVEIKTTIRPVSEARTATRTAA